MRKWKLLAAVLTAAFVTPVSFAQEDLRKDLNELRSRVTALESENATLKSQVAGQDDQALEEQINALAERYAGTTVKSGANPVTLSGEFRFRGSWSLGDNAVPLGAGFDEEHDGSWTDAMVRLGFQYEFTRDVVAFAETQAHWGFGDNATTDFGETNTPVRLHQGWLEIRNIFGRPEFSSRTGRQEIVLGNQFQFGNADWYNGWAFDGTRWDWDSESFSIAAIAAKLDTVDADFNQVPSYFNSHDDDELYSLYFTLKTIRNHALDIYWIYINGHGGAADGGSGVSVGALGNTVGTLAGFGTTAYYHTIGARIGGVFPDIAAGLDWNLEAAYQFGDQNTAAGGDADVDGFAVEGELGVTFGRDSRFRIYVRGLWATGPEDDETGYIPLYPNRHSNSGFRARYGLFDVIPMSNVFSLQAGFHFDPDPAWTLGATVLWATTEEDVAGLDDDDYGWEIDVWGEYRYSDHLIFGAGLAFLFADDALLVFEPVDDDLQFYAYLQARLLF